MSKAKLPNQIDVIIPIYNAIDYVKLCIKSVLTKDAGFPFKLILINDASPDTNIAKYLASIDDPRVTVLENEQNLGFVGTCNKGITYSRNDVILLNSDTEVTKGWIKRLVTCAYSQKNVATVSPFTNAGAGILNVPDFYKNNSIPENFDLDSWDSVINEISLEKFPKTFTNVGYCFYMRRNVIDKIGILDHETFGKGNGEESDFCLRARRNGYVNLICDNLLIQHEGSSVSFKEQPQISDSKKALVERNTKILNERYPEFQPWLDNFLSNDPLADIHSNIWFASTFFSTKKRIVHVVNQDVDADIGGIEIYIRQIAKNLGDFDHFTLSIQKDYIQIAKLNSNQFQKLYIPLIQRLDTYKLDNPKMLINFEKALKVVNPNLVHFHGILNKPVDLLTVPKKLGINTFITIHDFSLFYPPYWKFKINESADIWDSIVQLIDSSEVPYYRKRKQKIMVSLGMVDKIIANSEYTLSTLKRSLPLVIREKVELIENAVEKLEVKQSHKEGKICVAWVGTFTKLKGSHEFIDLLKKDVKSEFNWYVYGEIDKSDSYASQAINELESSKKVNVYGKYHLNDLPAILSAIDIVLMPSQVSETFSYSLSEVLQAGIHVISSNEGAIGSRLKNYKVGDVLETNNYTNEAFKLLKKYNANRTLLKIKKQQAKNVHLLPIKKHMEQLNKSYLKAFSDKKIYTGKDKLKLNFLRVNSINYTNSGRYTKTGFGSKLYYRLYVTIKSTPLFNFAKKAWHLLKQSS